MPPPVVACRLPAVNHANIGVRAALVQERIHAAAERAGRDPASVDVLPITKGHPAATIVDVAACGFRRIGENRVDEAERKRGALVDLAVEWHMVGHVQRNKAARVVRTFDVVESVDSLRLASRLSHAVVDADREPLRVLVQVNASGESTKGGFPVDEAIDPIGQVCAFPGLEVQGLMTMAPFVEDEDLLRSVFRRTRVLFDRCAELPGFTARVLSMGMSNDFELAVEEGSTELRLGTILVGERPGR